MKFHIRQRDRETEKLTERHDERLTHVRQINRWTDMQTVRQMDRQTGGEASKETGW